LRQKDLEIAKNQELEGVLRMTEQRLKDLELVLEGLKRDYEGLRYSNEALVERNHDLR